ncbi:hypothetical protein NOF55_22465 [Rhizobiaceae bacterium BDR2-2]|uniref:Uncharacterized protein n=1 Tax=Ectorhizobium quercum TaxID=2965071 RepID=A0AAE3N794_9HYPH|nr:hypothetical protein [Ectorhizobium quercum]MCX8999872.1 hypothetical protein [Ectorhizobium quercum]
MSDRSNAHEGVAWAKQRLDDLDTLISEAEKSIGGLKERAREEAENALARLRQSRDTLEKYQGGLRARADAAKQTVEEFPNALEAEWVEVEAAFQSLLSAVGDRTDAAREIVAARVKAQRQSWEASVKELRDQAAETVDKARGEMDVAISRLSEEAEKFQARIGEAKDAGDVSWEAVKSGLAEARAVHDRTIRKIRDAFSRRT